MAVTDRWHRSHPDDDAKPCKCGTARRPLYPTAEHEQGDQWQVRWRDDEGTPHKLNRPRRGGKRDESNPAIFAEALDAKITAELNAGTYTDPSAGKVTLESYAKDWRKGLTGDLGTLERVDDRLAHIFAGEIAGKEMVLLAKRPSLIQQWVRGLEAKGLGPSTIKVTVGVLSTVFSVAVIDGVVNRNPVKTDAVKPPPVTPKKVVPWTLDMLIAAREDLPGEYGAMADLCGGCGHRQGEAFGIAVDDIDFLGRQVHVRRQVRIIGKRLVFSLPKGNKERTVPLPDAVGLRLAAHIKAHPPVKVTLPWKTPDGKPHTAKLLFVSEHGGALNRHEFRYLWHSARDAAGAPAGRENGMHVLRHTAASAWLAAGVDILTVAAYLGHANASFTLRTYTHLMPTAADRARKAMDEFFKIPEQSARKVPSEGAK